METNAGGSAAPPVLLQARHPVGDGGGWGSRGRLTPGKVFAAKWVLIQIMCCDHPCGSSVQSHGVTALDFSGVTSRAGLESGILKLNLFWPSGRTGMRHRAANTVISP